jgi:carboxypeptidase Q
MDDGGGVLAAWEAVRLMKTLGLKQRRTVRVVAWTNEENGGAGGRGYRNQHLADVPKHVAAMESDNGVFRPLGYKFVGSDSALAIAKQIATLLKRIDADKMEFGGGEADVGPLLADGVPGFGLDVEPSKYFSYHHSSGDMLTVIDRQDFAKCIATMAVVAYVLADMPGTLPRSANPSANRPRR